MHSNKLNELHLRRAMKSGRKPLGKPRGGPRAPNEKEIRGALQWAKDNFEREGEIEIDLEPNGKKLSDLISACDNFRKEQGFYVRAWIWVPFENPFDHNSSPDGCKSPCAACNWEQFS